MKNSKGKFIVIFLLLLTLCVSLVAIAACKKPADPVTPPTDTEPTEPSEPIQPELHTHKFELTSETPATCTTPGSKTFTCSCGEHYTETQPALEHELQWVKDDQLHWQKCSRCDYQTEKVAHVYRVVSTEKQSTCTEQGQQTVQCECGSSKTESLPTLQHKFTVSRYNDTEHWTECQECGTKQEGSIAAHSLEIRSHDDASCTTQGATVRSCACGYSEKEIIDALGHDIDRTKIVDQGTAGQGHAYACKRCTAWEYEAHTYAACECPDGNAKEATCGQAGHTDEKCTACGFLHETEIPATGKHTPSQDYQSNDNGHWHTCLVCKQDLALEPHADLVEEQIVPPTCTTGGITVQICSVCNYEHRHSTDRTAHSYGNYQWNDNKHWKECTSCGYRNEGNHNLVETDRQSATCTEPGFYEQSCTACGYTTTTSIEAHHAWYTVDDGRVDPTCTAFGSHVERCDACGQTRTVVDENLGYAAHEIVEVPEKAPTETESGWKQHFACKNCGQKFRTHTDAYPVSDYDVYLPALNGERVGTIAELIDIAQRQYKYAASKSLYEITAKATEIGTNDMMISDETGALYLSFENCRYDLSTITEEESVTVRGHIQADGDYDAVFLAAEIVSVDDGYEETATLTVNLTGDVSGAIFNAQSDGEQFTLALYSTPCYTVYFNSLWVGETLSFTYECYNKVIVRSIEINGESYAMTNGELTVDITGDMVCNFDFNEYSELNGTVDNFDLPFNAPAQRVNGYLSYQFKNNKTGDTNIVQNSSLLFTVKNAYITRVVIEFENDNPIEASKNTIKVGTDDNHKQSYAYSSSGTRLKLEFNSGSHYTVFEYCADNSQARIKSITIYYETYNS